VPIAKTVSGLFLLDDLDSLGAWIKERSPSDAYASHVFDTADKKSGAASSKWTVNPHPGQAYGVLKKNIELGTAPKRVHIWHKCSSTLTGTDAYGFQGFTDGQNVVGSHSGTDGFTEDWTLHTGTTYFSGVRECRVGLTSATGTSGGQCIGRVDRLVIFNSLNIIVTGLTVGQKVEVFRASDNTLLATATCQAGQTSVSLAIADSEDVPEQMYMKIYATNGTTLIETTPSYEMIGGDTWDWTAAAGTLSITVDADIIYRSAAAGTPKTCNVTALLKTPGGAPYPGATIYFYTTLGAVNPTSDVTDGDGKAHTALTSTSHGLAVLKAQWLGDASVPACSAYYTVHVFYETESSDASKDFQFFCQGIEYSFVRGSYSLNEIGKPCEFEVEIPEWLTTLTPNGYVNIYRKGVREFHGIFREFERTLSPQVVLKGPDVSFLLDDRVVDTKIYSAQTPQYIINDLLNSFPCGISSGALGSCASVLTITIDTESLLKAIGRIVEMVNWKYRVTLARTLDFAESFSGGNTSARFKEGINLCGDSRRKVSFYSVRNRVRMRGDGITSTKQDGSKIQSQGLHELPAFQKSISNQSTLDTACQALLDLKKAEEETIPIEAIDEYDPGTFGPEDNVYVLSATLGLDGYYSVRQITRDMTDAEYARLELSNRLKEWWELDAEYRRMTKDISV